MPAISKSELRKWVEEQVRALIDCGVDPEDAEETMREVLAEIPSDQDPREYWPPVIQKSAEISDAEVEQARRAWRHDESIPFKYRNLLDAVELPEED